MESRFLIFFSTQKTSNKFENDERKNEPRDLERKLVESKRKFKAPTNDGKNSRISTTSWLCSFLVTAKICRFVKFVGNIFSPRRRTFSPTILGLRSISPPKKRFDLPQIELWHCIKRPNQKSFEITINKATSFSIFATNVWQNATKFGENLNNSEIRDEKNEILPKPNFPVWFVNSQINFSNCFFFSFRRTEIQRVCVDNLRRFHFLKLKQLYRETQEIIRSSTRDGTFSSIERDFQASLDQMKFHRSATIKLESPQSNPAFPYRPEFDQNYLSYRTRSSCDSKSTDDDRVTIDTCDRIIEYCGLIENTDESSFLCQFRSVFLDAPLDDFIRGIEILRSLTKFPLTSKPFEHWDIRSFTMRLFFNFSFFKEMENVRIRFHTNNRRPKKRSADSQFFLSSPTRTVDFDRLPPSN